MLIVHAHLWVDEAHPGKAREVCSGRRVFHHDQGRAVPGFVRAGIERCAPVQCAPVVKHVKAVVN